MIYIWINAPAILAATLASMVLAALWFRRGATPGTLITGFVAAAWLCAILAGALILAPPKGSVWTMTIGSAVVIWAGFVLPAVAASYRWRGLSWRTVASDTGCWLAMMIVQSVVLRLIGLVPPPA